MGLKRFPVLLLALAGLILAAGCEAGELREETEVVELGGAEEVVADITMGAGQLTLAGGAEALLNAEFIYNVDEWEPEVAYDVSGAQGVLTVRQPVGLDLSLRDVRYEWELHLNNEVPTDLRVALGAGESTMALSGMNLTNLRVTMGAGETSVDLRGGWPQDFHVDIKGGVGQANLLLPEAVGVRVDVSGGLGQVVATNMEREDGAYVNAAYGESDVTLRINIDGGVGQINMDVAD